MVLIVGYLLIFISLIPLIRNDNWVFRVFEYPRAQKLTINVFLFVAFILVADFALDHDKLFAVLLGANMIYLFYQIWPYTYLSKYQMKRSVSTDDSRRFRLMICNVFQENRNVKACLASVKQNNPDILLLVETDRWWKEELDKVLKEKYEFRVSKPLENTYGMLLYSKFPLIDPAIKFLIEDDVPSIHTKVELPSRQIFQLYCLHPKPPVPQENARSTERDAEMLMVAKKAKALSSPVIVAGDMNDVAWSYTTELFLKVSQLLDPRRGRGFYNTFHANHWFLRWPLDHIFCSVHFQLGALKRLPPVGSDHFPILVDLVLQEEQAGENSKEVLKANSAAAEMAEEKIEKAS